MRCSRGLLNLRPGGDGRKRKCHALSSGGRSPDRVSFGYVTLSLSMTLSVAPIAFGGGFDNPRLGETINPHLSSLMFKSPCHRKTIHSLSAMYHRTSVNDEAPHKLCPPSLLRLTINKARRALYLDCTSCFFEVRSDMQQLRSFRCGRPSFVFQLQPYIVEAYLIIWYIIPSLMRKQFLSDQHKKSRVIRQTDALTLKSDQVGRGLITQ